MKNFKILFLLISLLFCLGGTIKADTLYVQLPGNNQFLCQDINNFDTFVFYKPNGFGSTTWKINHIPYYLGDTLVYTPTSIGTTSIIASWNGFDATTSLELFSAPPLHAQFDAWPDATINGTNDTIWLCGSSTDIGSLVDPICTSWLWTGPGVYSTTPGGPVNVSNPGMYILTVSNPCGVTRDTFQLVSLPTIVPVFAADTTFCNAPVSLTLDPGPGWTYDWNTSSDTQTLLVTTTGTYTVNLTNLCTSGSATTTVYHQSYPIPDLTYLQGPPMCAATVLVLDPSPGYTYSSYTWSTDSITNSISISGLTGGGGTYYVTVTQSACVEVVSGTFTYLPLPSKPSLCVATVDALTGDNKLTWEVSQAGIASYDVYQLTSGYTLIGNVPNTPGATTLSFYDLVTNPMSSAARYKIAARDSACNAPSEQSFYHGTIKINSNPGTGGGVDLTVTDPYVDESGVYTPTKYYILIDSLNNGNLTMKDSINAVFNSYTINNPYLGATYVMAVALPWAGCNSGNKTVNFNQMSFSNKSSIITSIATITSDILVSIYPNPSSDGIFRVEGANISHVEVFDMLGNMLLTTKETINLTAYTKGIYNVRIISTMGSTSYQKIVLQ